MSTPKHPIRILAIIPYQVFPAIMGGQKGIALFYKYLSRLVSLTAFTTQNNRPEPGLQIINTLSNAVFRYVNPFNYFTIRKHARECQATHLLFEHPYFAWLIWLFKIGSPYHIIVHSHNIESERFKSIGKWWWKILWYYERAAYKSAHQVWFKTPEDKQYATIHYGVREEACHIISYGIEAVALPTNAELNEARETLLSQYSIAPNDILILFNGTLSYKPNLDALKAIIEKINPYLLQTSLSYKMLICGKNLPDTFNQLLDYKHQHIIYCGFVDDIDLYFKGCDVFLNPLQDGGGIKTKLVEALGFGKVSISSQNGAIGVDAAYTGGRLTIVADKDWRAYSDAIVKHHQPINNDNAAFYKHFSWHSIATKAVEAMMNSDVK
ncbi:MAG: glycosyltransferase family 4 protein [Bacteroidetes bacterium]|nr:glycosyltransferase family 4 protein [Bacteroidota bacterium]